MAASEDPSDEKFPKSSRILNRSTFRRVYDEGKKYQARYFTAFVMPRGDGSSDESGPRIGITVTKKVGNSVERNRCRRLVREVFRKNKWRVPSGIDIVINVKSSLLNQSSDELEGDFFKFLEKSKWDES